MKKYLVIGLIVGLLFCSVGICRGKLSKRGKLVAVNSSRGGVLVKEGKKITGYKLALNAEVKLNGRSVDLEEFKLNSTSSFPKVKLLLTKDKKIKSISAFYKELPIKVIKVKAGRIIFKNLKTEKIKKYKLNKKIKLVKNNSLVSLAELNKGDRGTAVLGVNGRIQKFELQNYQFKSRD